MNKKMRMLSILFMASSLLSGVSTVNSEFATGYATINHIMTNDQTGIAASNKKANVVFADVQNIAQDLNLAAVVDYFDCKTQMGASFLQEALAYPVSPTDQSGIIAKRARLIKALVENPELKAHVERLLTVAQEAEVGVAELFSDAFKARACPELAEIEMFKKSPLGFHHFIAKAKMAVNESDKLNAANEAYNAVNGGISSWVLSKILPRLHAIWKLDKQTFASLMRDPAFAFEYKIMRQFSVLAMVTTPYIGYTLYKSYSTAIKKRDKLHSLNRLVCIADKLEELASVYNLDLQFLISNIKGSQAKATLQELRKSRYNKKDTKFFYTPKVHAFVYNLYLHHQLDLAEIFACIAELDACNAIATKIVMQTEQNPWCFAQEVHAENPLVQAQQLWNVLVAKAVANDFSEHRNVVLSGPNAGGKTTFIRSVLQNILLAQSFGVAAAASFAYTPFDYIHSFIHISDDLMNGLSLFASEVKRAKDIVACIKAMQPGQKYFFALDELFTGTNAEDGQACACEYLSKLASYDNIQFIYATHFEKLKEMAELEPACANYKVDAPDRLENGELVYPFTISQGASEVHVGIDIATNAGLFD